MARYNGYRSAFELGRLAVSLARDYNDALVVHERNSGFGESFLHGVGDYGNLYIEHRTDRKSGLSGTRIGWQTTATTKGTIIGALQKAIKEQGIEVHSIQVVDCLRSISMGPDRRVLEVERQHDEDMIVLGLACHLLETTPIYGVKVVSLKDKVMSALGLRRMEVQDAPFDV